MPPAQQLYGLVYVSRSACPGDAGWLDVEVTNILATSKVNNRQAGVTGGLLFSSECFAQTLEGSMDEVEATFERIQCDPRRHDTVILQAGPVDRRDFGDWSMAYAGRVDDQKLRFAQYTDGAERQDGMGETILHLMRGVVRRSEPV